MDQSYVHMVKKFSDEPGLVYKPLFIHDSYTYTGQMKEVDETNKDLFPNASQFRHGYGVECMISGNKYEGYFNNDKYNGEGVYTYNWGDKYEGEWLDDYMHGKGTFTWTDGRKYEGYWVKSKIQGKGVFIHANGDQ